MHTIDIEHTHRPCSTDKNETHRCQAQDIRGSRVSDSADKEQTALMVFRNDDSFQRKNDLVPNMTISCEERTTAEASLSFDKLVLRERLANRCKS